MGYDLHITRREFWADEGEDILESEWKELVDSDQTLVFDPALGDDMVRFCGNSKYADPWLCWFKGEISSKWPDTALILKMIEIAKKLDANVQGDDGERYESTKDIPENYDDSLSF